MKWIGEIVSGVTYPIPPFTMITDDEKTVVYTITGYIPNTIENEFQIGQVDLPQDGTTINVKCIQGIAVKYDINGDTVITPQHLDSENRIYFNVSNIAENGIFITNIGQTTNYGQWERRDNLLIEDFGNYFYKFGVTADGTSCYLEFPEDCEELMKDGIEITYIRSDGAYGNITPNQLSNFYSDLAVINSIGDNVVLNASNVKIRNYFASTNGKDYENIDDAYKNYKRVVGTFNTLVTLRDYFNYIVSNKLVSNGFVCDRSNDLQNVYDIMTYSNGVNHLKSIIEESSGGIPDLTAFSIKLYFTKYFDDVSTVNSFNGTFQPLSVTEAENVQKYVEDIKSLQHDFVALESPNDTFSHFCMFKNKYPVLCSIIPQYALSTAQKAEVIKNIRLALYQYLNAKEIEFGDKIQDDYLYTIILNSDNRIKNVILDNINYTTYAVWYDDTTHLFYETQVSGDLEDSYEIESDPSTLVNDISVDITKYLSTITDYNPVQFNFTYSTMTWSINGNSVNLSDYGITVSPTPSADSSFTLTLSKQTQFRNEILAKSILAGVTPLVVHAEQFDYQMNQSLSPNIPEIDGHNQNIISNIVSVYPETTITIASSQSDIINGSYILRDNESIEFFASNLLPQSTYNNYVKYECSLIDDIEPNIYYMLKQNEYIVFYWKSSSSDTIYSYTMYGEGSIIKSSFLLSSNNRTQIANELFTRLPNTTPKVINSDYYTLSFSESQEIQDLKYTDNILSDNKEIQNFITNNITIDNTMYCYWVLNQSTGNQDEQSYVLFPDGSDVRLLDVGEYFFYTNKEMTNLIALGEGTRISKTGPETTESWTVAAISLTDITLNGIDALNGYWYKPQGSVEVTEQQFITINSGYELRLKLKDQNKDPDNPISSWQVVIDGDGCTFTDTTSGSGSAPELSFEDFNISYRPDLQSSQSVSLPDLNLSEELSWSAKSLLGLNISNTTSQILLDNQSLTIHQLDNDTPIEIEGEAVDGSVYPVVLLADHNLQITGSVESSTIYYNDYYEMEYLSLYVFAQQGTRTGKVQYGQDGCSIPILKDETSSDTNNPAEFMFPDGDYIIPASIPDFENVLVEVNVTQDGTTLTPLAPLYDPDLTLIPGGKLYPLTLNVNVDLDDPSVANFQIIIKLYDEEDPTSSIQAPQNMSVQFFNPLKYIPSDDLNKKVALIKLFDKDDMYNYTYEVNSDILIENPLEAKQFLNSNHIYNRFTICQMDTSTSTKIQVN